MAGGYKPYIELSKIDRFIEDQKECSAQTLDLGLKFNITVARGELSSVQTRFEPIQPEQ